MQVGLNSIALAMENNVFLALTHRFGKQPLPVSFVQMLV